MDHSTACDIERPSQRMIATERPYIEDVLDKYSCLENLTVLALGSSYWTPPQEALDQLITEQGMSSRDTHRYGNIQGYTPLREKLLTDLSGRGLDVSDQDILISAGANQGFTNLFLLLVDPGECTVLLAPYYFSHKLALQMCGSNVIVCPFNRENLMPDWEALKKIFSTYRVKAVVLTTPNNPSGAVWSASAITDLIDLCRANESWLIADQTYHDFLFDDAKHVYPCAHRFNYSRVLHVFSLSKSFGMPGWRVGYIVYPNNLTEQMRKIQDTVPTHASIISQKLAFNCLKHNEQATLASANGQSWILEKVMGLVDVRERIWSLVEPLGAIKTKGAFYFLVPVPPLVDEEEAIDILARRYGVLLMLGSPFGAQGFMRLSYGSIPPEQAIESIGKLELGFNHLVMLSKSRASKENFLQ